MESKFADQNGELGADDIRTMLSQAGLLPTGQRIALASLLRRKDDTHVSAEGLYEELAASGVKCSLSSIYRLLRELNESGIIKRMPLWGQGLLRYRTYTSSSFLCSRGRSAD